MWAGGSLRFYYSESTGGGLRLGRTAVCKEKVDAVKSKGEGEDEKLFVEFLREYKEVEADGKELAPAVVERRDIVFFRSLAKKGNPRVIQGTQNSTTAGIG